ncbi:putative sporulation protein YtxC [Clostridium bornimense]|uniref:putative sporulation protein YtxC n=1 Tax=Clostridium bornimense TaxID=1216932 RepID=UPI001C11CC21|nr:putative sporulation protein YtxC [Clostridium bornimense]MBU5316920.1 putative sporulation protein YtxC [Clostridium bornimense]
MLLLTLSCRESKDKFFIKMVEVKEKIHNSNGVNIGIYEYMNNGEDYLSLYCNDEYVNEKFMNYIYYNIGECIYHIMSKEYCKNRISKYLSKNYSYVDKEENDIIKKKTLDILLREEYKEEENGRIIFLNRKNIAIKNIVNVLRENKEVNLEGILTFRMNEFANVIEPIVDKVFEIYTIEKEYDEFIGLLKHFIKGVESKIYMINIDIDKNGKYKILDENGIDLLNEVDGSVMADLLIGVCNIEDVILSLLISNVPKKVRIHGESNAKNKEFIKTIKNVFEDRVISLEEIKVNIDSLN